MKDGQKWGGDAGGMLSILTETSSILYNSVEMACHIVFLSL